MNLIAAQQNDEFKKVKDYFDYQRFMLNNSFKKEYEKELATTSKIAIKRDFEEFMRKMDSIQNVAFIGALIKVKNREDLSVLDEKNGQKETVANKPKKANIKLPNTEITESELSLPEYPGGINALRNQISELFYYDSTNSGFKTIKTNIAFVVEKDGSISFVHAEGENFALNRQAEIAVYMLPEHFSPANINGQNVRYRFRLPITMNLE